MIKIRCYEITSQLSQRMHILLHKERHILQAQNVSDPSLERPTGEV